MGTRHAFPSPRALSGESLGSRKQTKHLLRPRPYPNLVSLVIPLFNEEAGFSALRAELEKFARTLECRVEIVLVNDGSTDTTLARIAEMASEDLRVKALHLSRNFGHQVAATAGLDYAKGDAVVLIDADLQDPLYGKHHINPTVRTGCLRGIVGM